MATERESTIPPEPPSPCRKRKALKVTIEPEKMQPRVARAKRIMAAIRTGRRPYLSLTGPKKIWPMASPSMDVVSPSCTIEGVV